MLLLQLRQQKQLNTKPQIKEDSTLTNQNNKSLQIAYSYCPPIEVNNAGPLINRKEINMATE